MVAIDGSHNCCFARLTLCTRFYVPGQQILALEALQFMTFPFGGGTLYLTRTTGSPDFDYVDSDIRLHLCPGSTPLLVTKFLFGFQIWSKSLVPPSPLLQTTNTQPFCPVMPRAPFDPAPAPESGLARYRLLSARAGVHVSPIQLGGMSIGDKWADIGFGHMDKESSFKLLDAYFDHGGNFIDTASV